MRAPGPASRVRAVLRIAPALLLLSSAQARAEKAVFVVRHAEKQSPESSAPEVPLSHGGTARAERLAAMLRDAGINAIYATETVRARETAAPLARAVGRPVQAYSAVPALADTLRADPSAVALVVGHSNTVPELLAALGVKQKVTVTDPEYDNLFVVIPQVSGDPVLLRLKY
jgi:phosphohistidine phosphatase SixA